MDLDLTIRTTAVQLALANYPGGGDARGLVADAAVIETYLRGTPSSQELGQEARREVDAGETTRFADTTALVADLNS